MSMLSTPLTPGKRLFYAIPEDSHEKYCVDASPASEINSTSEQLLTLVNENVVGKDALFRGPFGVRKVVYCDYVASGRSLKFIELFLQNHVLPMYGNTHTTTSVTSLQSTMFRHEARDIIRNSVRASEHDAVIFAGNGATGAIHKLIKALNLSEPPVVFCGPFVHHSNLLPWREKAAHVLNISESANGSVNLNHLETALCEWKSAGLPMMGCFTAASNITGQICDTIAISKLLHRYGALAFWDYATAAPYVDIDMHPVVEEGDASKDAIFISPHKFVGGVETPGILVAARKLFRNSIPSGCGGGSVFFVSEEDHRYLQDVEAREEGGTPSIVGAIRAGLVFKLKQDIGHTLIMERENYLYRRAIKTWKDVKNLEMLGSQGMIEADGEKLAIFSFLIRHSQSGLYLHYNFIAAILNDMFGMQVRGGCACAGPFAQRLLGINIQKAKLFEKLLMEDSRLDRMHLRRRAEHSLHEVLRPGFVRLNLPYFIGDEEADFIINAIKMIAEYGWTMLPQYMFNPETGEWRHVRHQVYKGRKWLSHVRFTADGMQFKSLESAETKDTLPSTYANCLREAKDNFEKSVKASDAFFPDHPVMFDKSVGDLRWFLTPSEAQKWLSKQHGRTAPALQTRDPPFVIRKTVKQLMPEEILSICKMPRIIQTKVAYIAAQSWNGSSFVGNGNKDCGVAVEDIAVVYDSELAKTIPETGKMREKADIKRLIDEHDVTNTGKSSVNEGESRQFVSTRKDAAAVETRVPGDNCDVKVAKFISPPKRLFKLTVQAVEEFNMINNGDKVLVCLSGGKDSLSLLHTLRQYQFYAKKQGVLFELGAVTVDPKTASYDPSPLIQYLAALRLPYFYETQAILDQALALPELTSICAFCSRMKRGRLYNCARREGWNVLAMGQHLDDLAESFLMSAFQNGLLRTMKANYVVQEGDLRVIRPFVYVRERDTREFAEGSKLPIIPENCPACFEAPKERHRMKQLLASQEIIHPKLFYSLKEALLPLMSKKRTGLESRQMLHSLPVVDDDQL